MSGKSIGEYGILSTECAAALPSFRYPSTEILKKLKRLIQRVLCTTRILILIETNLQLKPRELANLSAVY